VKNTLPKVDQLSALPLDAATGGEEKDVLL
jgi:hypothetical protein